MNRSSTLQAVAAALFVTCFACIAATDEARPLDALPYTPALDVEAMDRSIDPCVDFYEYSCGGWKRRNPIPPDQAHWDVYTKLATENLQFLWGLLAKAAEPRAEFDRHLQLCPACRAYLEGLRAAVALGRGAYEEEIESSEAREPFPEELVTAILATRG